MQTAVNRRAARGVAIPETLHPEVAAALRAGGIDRLWSHQADALHAAGPAGVWAPPGPTARRRRRGGPAAHGPARGLGRASPPLATRGGRAGRPPGLEEVRVIAGAGPPAPHRRGAMGTPPITDEKTA